MKLVIIIDETRFYHPDMLADFIRRTKDEVMGVCIVTKIPKKNSIEVYLKRHFYFLSFVEIYKLVNRKFIYSVFDFFNRPTRNSKHFYSVKTVCKTFEIPFCFVQNSLNNTPVIDFISSFHPDIIISSNSLYFTKKILNIPRIACINRHSGLLPSYGGLWPVFQSLRNGENKVGVTIHVMVEKIDQGPVLSQQEIAVEDSDTVADLYEKCFILSSALLLEALDSIRMNDIQTKINNYSPSYYSFPLAGHWKEFRRRGRKFI
jgi:methionyl-tRNA formyltransferase